MRGQLKEASSVTSKAFCAFRKELDPDLEGQNSEIVGAEEVLEETRMSQAITIMKPILRYLQLLCENHNADLQVLAPFFQKEPEGPSALKLPADGLFFCSRTFCATRPTRRTTIWCVRLFSSWTVFVEAPLEASGYWAFTLMRVMWTWFAKPWKLSQSTPKGPAMKTR